MKRKALIFIICMILTVAGCASGSRESAGQSGSPAGSGMERIEGEQGAEALPPTVEAEASEIVFSEAEGDTTLTDIVGKDVAWFKGMHLYNGNRITTRTESYAWLALDESKAAKVDQLSSVEVSKSGKKLQLLLSAGEMFFNVTKPLSDDESMNIRTSTMVMGIRGTAGFVRVVDRNCSEIYILEGTVTVTGYDPGSGETKTVSITAGQKAVCELYEGQSAGSRVEIIVSSYGDDDVPVYVLGEIAGDSELQEKIRVANSGTGAGMVYGGVAAGGLSVEGMLADFEQRRDEETARREKLLADADTALQDWLEEDPDITDEMFHRNDILLADSDTGKDSAVSSSESGTKAAENPSSGKNENQTAEETSGETVEDPDSDEGNSSEEDPNGTNDPVIETAYKNLKINTAKSVKGGDYQNLTIGAGVGNGDVTLSNVNIHGNLTVRGGGQNSVHLDHCVIEGVVLLDKDVSDGGEPVRLVVENGTKLSSVMVSEEAIVDVAEGSCVETINAEAPVKVKTADASVPAVTMSADCPEVTVNDEPVQLPHLDFAIDDLPVDVHEHSFDTVEEVVGSDCRGTGYTLKKCSCGCIFIEADSDPGQVEHDYAKAGHVAGTGCTAGPGYDLYKCKVCGSTKKKFDPLIHNWKKDTDTGYYSECADCGISPAKALAQLFALSKDGTANISDLDPHTWNGSLETKKNYLLREALQIENGKTLNIEDGYALCSDSGIEISEGGTVIVGEGSSLLNSAGSTYKNYGTTVNNGVLTNAGTLTDDERGIVENNGEFICEGSKTTSSQMLMYGTLNNRGTAIFRGNVSNAGPSFFSGTINNMENAVLQVGVEYAGDYNVMWPSSFQGREKSCIVSNDGTIQINPWASFGMGSYAGGAHGEILCYGSASMGSGKNDGTILCDGSSAALTITGKYENNGKITLVNQGSASISNRALFHNTSSGEVVVSTMSNSDSGRVYYRGGFEIGMNGAEVRNDGVFRVVDGGEVYVDSKGKLYNTAGAFFYLGSDTDMDHSNYLTIRRDYSSGELGYVENEGDFILTSNNYQQEINSQGIFVNEGNLTLNGYSGVKIGCDITTKNLAQKDKQPHPGVFYNSGRITVSKLSRIDSYNTENGRSVFVNQRGGVILMEGALDNGCDMENEGEIYFEDRSLMHNSGNFVNREGAVIDVHKWLPMGYAYSPIYNRSWGTFANDGIIYCNADQLGYTLGQRYSPIENDGDSTSLTGIGLVLEYQSGN